MAESTDKESEPPIPKRRRIIERKVEENLDRSWEVNAFLANKTKPAFQSTPQKRYSHREIEEALEFERERVEGVPEIEGVTEIRDRLVVMSRTQLEELLNHFSSCMAKLSGEIRDLGNVLSYEIFT